MTTLGQAAGGAVLVRKQRRKRQEREPRISARERSDQAFLRGSPICQGKGLPEQLGAWWAVQLSTLTRGPGQDPQGSRTERPGDPGYLPAPGSVLVAPHQPAGIRQPEEKPWGHRLPPFVALHGSAGSGK